MLTDQRAWQTVFCRGLGELERGILYLVPAERWVLHLQIHLPVAQLRIVLHAVFGALYRKGANTGRLAVLCQFVLAKRRAPRFDMFVEFLLVLQAPKNRGEFLSTGPWRRARCGNASCWATEW